MKYDWKEAGEEWSAPWGSSAAQWNGTIFPRIRDCLPAGTILEIAPGFGRWTHYLKEYCEKLLAVDKSSECIEACRERFAADSRVRCYLNDGRSLAMIPDASVDFVFSFDSFVHPNRDVVEAYLRELGTKLKIGAKGFIHHSNFGEYIGTPRERVPEALAKPLIKLRILDWAHHRNPGMSAELFRALCAQHGLHCIGQELVNWRGRRLIDCLTLFVRSDSAQPEPTRIIRNPKFMREAARVRRQWRKPAGRIPRKPGRCSVRCSPSRSLVRSAGPQRMGHESALGQSKCAEESAHYSPMWKRSRRVSIAIA